MTSFPDLLDVLIIGAGPCGLAVAARLHEETPSAMFTDEEHQRYHWISKHSGRMALVQARHKGIKGVKAEKWNGGQTDVKSYRAGSAQKTRGSGSMSLSDVSYASTGSSTSDEEGDEPPSLSTSPESVASILAAEKGRMSEETEETNKGLSMLVLDSTGDKWMEKWNRAFRTLEIQQLRSPMFFHVDPGDRDGMLAYTQETGREKDLWEISGCVGKELSKHQKKKKQQKSKQCVPGLESFGVV